jgi:hypothetical protein
MNRIDDPRVRFYLEHQRLIEEWAAVRKDLIATAHSFYLSIGQMLEDRAPDIGPDVLVSISDAAWPRVGYHRFGWPLSADDQPAVGIYFEWKRGTSTFTDGWRGVGVRVDTGDPKGNGLRESIASQIRESRAKAGFPKSSSVWVAYTDIKPPTRTDYWDDLGPYAKSIVEIIESAWNHFSSAVDIAVSTAQI